MLHQEHLSQFCAFILVADAGCSLVFSSPRSVPGLEAFQSKPTFLAPCSYAGPFEYASPWDGATVMEWFPGPADLVVGAWAPHCGGASAMDPNEHFYSRSQGIYTLHLTPNTLKSKEIVTGKRNQKIEKTKPKTNLHQPQNIKMYNKLN